MRAIVLGAAAGGGFPQWNCACRGCRAVRDGEPGWEPRTQDSVAITADGARFCLLNASPDVLTQIARTPALAPRLGRASPIAAVVLTNGDLDHVLGLFSMRESTPIALYATEVVRRGLEASVFLRTFGRVPGHLVARTLVPGEEIALADAAGAPLGLRVRALALPGKPPIHARSAPSPGDNVALVLREEGARRTWCYASACAHLDGVELGGHEVLLFDGTFFHEDELPRHGLGTASAREMAHLPIAGSRGSLAGIAGIAGRTIYTHVNNTNPILGPTAERALVLRGGFEIAHDGMEIGP